MPPYRASVGGQYGSGIYPDSRPRIDVGQLIDAATGGATSLIHATMLRTQNQRELARQAEQDKLARDQITYQRSRDQKEDARRDEEASERRAEATARRRKEDRDFIIAGGVPEHTETQAVPGQTTMPAIEPVSPIKRAMTGGFQSQVPNTALGQPDGIPGVQITPSDAPGSVAPVARPATVTSYHNESVDVPEHLDPTKSSAYARAVEVEKLRGEGWMSRDEARAKAQTELQEKRLVAQQKMREYSSQAATALAKWKQEHPVPKSAIARQMTGNAGSALAEKVADGLLVQADGNLQDAVDHLEGTDEGRALAAQGVTKAHLLAAYGKSKRADVTGALRLQAGSSGLSPDKAVDAVSKTKVRLAPPKSSDAGVPTAVASTKAKQPPPETQEEYDFLIGRGMNDADIVKRYGEPAKGVKRKTDEKK